MNETSAPSTRTEKLQALGHSITIKPAKPLRIRRGHSTAIVLEIKGDIDVQPIGGHFVPSKTGTYGAQTQARFWLDRDIPSGWLTVFVEGDAEPVTTRKPVGYSSTTLAYMAGPTIPRFLGADIDDEPDKFRIPGLVKKIVVFLAIALGLGFVAYEIFSRVF